MGSGMSRALTFIIAGTGSLGFYVLGLPLPFLLGPMFACLVAALGGLNHKGAGQFGIFMRTFLGIAVGSSITTKLLGRMPEIGSSLAFVPLFIATIVLLGYPLFRHRFGFDPVTSWDSSMLGGLQDVHILGEEVRATHVRAL